jgi:hypothetical protein
LEIANLGSSRYRKYNYFVLFSRINIIRHHMPRFFFRICQGDFAGTSGEGFDLADRDAAWTEMTMVGSDLVSGATRKLKQNSEWQIELLDESETPLFRIRLVAETLDKVSAASRVR